MSHEKDTEANTCLPADKGERPGLTGLTGV